MDEMNGQIIEQTNEPLTENSVFSVPMNIKSLTGWATFKAVIDIIAGAAASASIIGAAYGVPMIIAAVKLLNFVEEIKVATANNDRQKIVDSMSFLQRYFKINGIATIVSIGVTILLVVLYILFIVFLITASPDFKSTFESSGQWF